MGGVTRETEQEGHKVTVVLENIIIQTNTDKNADSKKEYVISYSLMKIMALKETGSI